MTFYKISGDYSLDIPQKCFFFFFGNKSFQKGPNDLKLASFFSVTLNQSFLLWLANLP